MGKRGGNSIFGQKSVPEMCRRLISRSRAYCVIAIDGADNVKVAGDVTKMGKPSGEIQEMFSSLVTHMYNGAVVLQEMAKRKDGAEKQDKLVAAAKAKRSEELQCNQ